VRVTPGWTARFIAAKVERESLFKFVIAVRSMPAISAVHAAIARCASVEAGDHEIGCSRLIRVFRRTVGIVYGVSRD
jgi:hypothetical protein